MELLYICIAILGMASSSLANSGAMMNMATITDLDVKCDKSGMTVTIDFTQPFNGIIFSKGHYSDPNCRYVDENSGRSSYTLSISSERCGSEMGTSPRDDSITELTNTIIVQNDKYIQEIWDVARKINCEWVDSYLKAVNFNPFSVGMLQAQEVRFRGDSTIECWMDLQQGKYPDISAIQSVLKIGDALSLLIYAKDNNNQYDIAVKECFAFSSPDYNNPNTARLQLTNQNGCVLKDKLMSPFYMMREEIGSESTIVTYSHISAFKFPDAMDVFISCNVEVCKGDCDTQCSSQVTTTTASTPRRYGSTLFGEPIYTTKPTTVPTTTTPEPTTTEPEKCYPGSTDPKCKKSGSDSYPSPLECVPGSNDPRCVVTVPFTSTEKPRPRTTQKPRCYPGSKDPRCPKPKPKCYPGSQDPNCPPICYNGSTDPRCNKGKSIDNCYPGSTAKECQPTTTKAPDCYEGSLDPNCQFTTKDGRYGSILFPATITTTPTTTTTRRLTTPYRTTRRPTKPTTKKRTGGILFPDVRTTKPVRTTTVRYTTAAPRLKPKKTTTRAPPRGKQIDSEPKAKPEPSGDEWEGESRFHAFHNYHYQRGDGRRSRTFGQRLVPKTGIKRRVVRSVSERENPRPLVAKIPLQLMGTVHVIPPRNYPTLEVRERVVSSQSNEDSICLSSSSAIGFGFSFVITTLSSAVLMFLHFRNKKISKV